MERYIAKKTSYNYKQQLGYISKVKQKIYYNNSKLYNSIHAQFKTRQDYTILFRDTVFP